MQKRKLKQKAGRRARKHVDQAWEALESGDFKKALEEARLAVSERKDNPTVWNDYGLILEQAGDLPGAEKALRNAIVIAPSFAEAYANLATVTARLGRSVQAARLMRRATTLDPDSLVYNQKLGLYEELAEQVQAEPAHTMAPSDEGGAADPIAAISIFSARLRSYDWEQISAELTNTGCSPLRKLLGREECQYLIGLYHQDRFFEKTVPLGDSQGAGGSYRYLSTPLPKLVVTVRAAVYAMIAPIVNDWCGLLKTESRYPLTHQEYLEQCKDAGQERSTPILLRYSAPAVNHPHRDICGRLAFPLQLAITLNCRKSSDHAGFEGGQFTFDDEAVGRRAQHLEIETTEGDGVLFGSRDRLVRIAGGYGLQPVAHGMAALTAGERYVLGCPFHDYR